MLVKSQRGGVDMGDSLCEMGQVYQIESANQRVSESAKNTRLVGPRVRIGIHIFNYSCMEMLMALPSIIFSLMTMNG